MTGLKAIYKKELRSYFFSPVAYVAIGIFLFIMGMIFAKFVEIYHSYKIANRYGAAQNITLDRLALFLYQNMAFILCFLTPLITMRLFAEEKRQHTFELLLTAPVKGFELVFGKFLAAFTLMGTMVALSFSYALFMIAWGNPDVRIILSNYLGLLLSVGCYVALGTFFSSLTSNQMIAAVITFIALIFLWLLQTFAQGITVSFGPIEVGPTLVYISPLTHLNSFTEGVVQMKHLIYFVTFTGLLLFFTHRVVESNRWR
ncbi:MAG: ABC transporter permease subunit [Bdellovibrionales bacterium]|nr:ABC transporter permease subunit [Bdellovibrionales bacterium]